jgi:hypothetical protein
MDHFICTRITLFVLELLRMVASVDDALKPRVNHLSLFCSGSIYCILLCSYI